MLTKNYIIIQKHSIGSPDHPFIVLNNENKYFSNENKIFELKLKKSTYGLSNKYVLYDAKDNSELFNFKPSNNKWEIFDSKNEPLFKIICSNKFYIYSLKENDKSSNSFSFISSSKINVESYTVSFCNKAINENEQLRLLCGLNQWAIFIGNENLEVPWICKISSSKEKKNNYNIELAGNIDYTFMILITIFVLSVITAGLH